MKIYGTNCYEKEIYKLDLKNSKKIENCAVGDKAIYLGNYFFSNIYVFDIRNVKRVYKRVAMSKGGMSGKGIFVTLSYIVVEYNDNETFSCRLKTEDNVDLFLEEIKNKFPNIKLISEKAEETLRKRKEEKEKRKVKNLSDKAKEDLEILKKIKSKIDNNIKISNELCKAAKQKRKFMINGNSYGYVALILTILGIISVAYGIYAIIKGTGFGIYFTLFGFGAIFLFSSLNIFPTKKNNKKAIYKQYDNAKEKLEEFLNNEKELTFPKKYATSEVLKHLIIIIEEGRAENIEEAFLELVRYLKSLNQNVTVWQDEYEDIIKMKPIFLVEDYK